MVIHPDTGAGGRGSHRITCVLYHIQMNQLLTMSRLRSDGKTHHIAMSLLEDPNAVFLAHTRYHCHGMRCDAITVIRVAWVSVGERKQFRPGSHVSTCHTHVAAERSEVYTRIIIHGSRTHYCPQMPRHSTFFGARIHQYPVNALRCMFRPPTDIQHTRRGGHSTC